MKKVILIVISALFLTSAYAKTPIRNLHCANIQPIVSEYHYKDSMAYTLKGPYFVVYNGDYWKYVNVYKEDIYHFDGKNMRIKCYDKDDLIAIVVLSKLDRDSRDILSQLNLPKLSATELIEQESMYETQIQSYVNKANAGFVYRHSQHYKDSIREAQKEERHKYIIDMHRMLDSIENKRDSLREIEEFNAKMEKKRFDSIASHQADSIRQARYSRKEYITLTKKMVTVNSAGGANVWLSFINNSPKSIKYVWFSVTFYNNVDDLVSCEIQNTNTRTLKETGPIETGGQGGGKWEAVIYNNSTEYIKIKSIKIQYMDNTTLIVPSTFYQNNVREIWSY